jgi:vancomycin permeability regulator SanA
MAKKKLTETKKETGRSFGKVLARLLSALLIIVLTAGLAVAAINLFVCGKTKNRILDPEGEWPEPEEGEAEFDAIIVLGCSVLPGGEPSDMLADRVDAGVELFKQGRARLLVMSGDRSEYYDEVTAMADRALAAGIAPNYIVEDPEGFSTSESIERAANTFGFKRVIIVTQRYHLFRALYVAERCGLEAYGVGSDPRAYGGSLYYSLREVAARVKDFFKYLFV